jgi:exonuclease I
MLARAIRSRTGKSNLVQKQITQKMNQLSEIADKEYVNVLRARLKDVNLPDLRLEIEVGPAARSFPFRLSTKVRDTWEFGFGETLEQALTNLKAHLPTLAEQAQSDREMAAALLERAAKLEAAA